MNSEKRKDQPQLRLVVNNNELTEGSSIAAWPLKRAPKVDRKGFNVADARVFDLPASDFFNRSFREPCLRSYLAPATLRGLQTLQDELVHQTHRPKDSPENGFTQPSNGGDSPIGLSGMGRPRQPAARKTTIGAILTENAEALLPVSFPGETNQTNQIAALAKRMGIGKETVRRAIRGGASSRLDIVDSIAQGLGVTTPELLTPGFGLRRAAELRLQSRAEPLQRTAIGR